jgi:RND family efflux transporter MFP subunit
LKKIGIYAIGARTKLPSGTGVLLAFVLCAPIAAAGEPERMDCVITPSRLIDLSSAVAGLVERVEVERSDTVAEGQVIARLTSSVEHRDVDIARARSRMKSEIHLWQASLEYEDTNLGRLQSLHTGSHASANQRDIARRDSKLSTWKLRRAKDAFELRQLELLRARDVLEQKTIRSPINGVVVQRFKSEGEYVEDQPIVRLAQLDPLHVESIVPMQRFGSIRPGMRARVFAEGHEEQSYDAEVVVVDRLGDAASGTFGVRLSLPNPDNRLPSGLKCGVEFVPTPQTARVDPASKNSDLDTETARTDSNGEMLSVALVIPEAIALPVDQEKMSSNAETRATNEPRKTPDSIPPSSINASQGSGDLPQAKAPQKALCGSVGPLMDGDVARNIQVELKGRGYDPVLRKASAPKTIGYIVLAPRQDSNRATSDYQRQLSKKGIHEAAVTARGAYSGRLSVGVYNVAAPAERRRAALQKLGFNVEVVARTRPVSQWWLDLDRPVGEPGANRLRSTLESLHPPFGVELLSCQPLHTLASR